MTYRSRIAVLAFVACLPAIAGRPAQADPAALLSAAVETQAAASADQAVSAALAREDAALQSAIDRKVAARMNAVLAPPMPGRSRSMNLAAKPAARTEGSDRAFYAVK